MISSTLKEKSEFNNKIRSAQVNIYIEINKRIQKNRIKTLGRMFEHLTECLKSSPASFLVLLILFSFKTERTRLKHAAGSFLVKYAVASFYLISRNFRVWNIFISKTCFVQRYNIFPSVKVGQVNWPTAAV